MISRLHRAFLTALRVRADVGAQIFVIHQADASLRAALPQAKRSDGRLVPIARRRENQFIDRAPRKPGPSASLAGRRQAQEFRRVRLSRVWRRAFHRGGGCRAFLISCRSHTTRVTLAGLPKLLGQLWHV